MSPCLTRMLAVAVSMIVAVSSYGDAVEDVRKTEIAFAKAFADRDKDRFFSFVAADATFGNAGGKEKVVERWSRYFVPPVAPFSWGPERVAVNAAGTIGLSTGPVYDANGKHAGNFTTTWVKQSDGSWKALFDNSGPSPANLAEDALQTTEGFVQTEDGLKLHYRKVGRAPVTVIVPLGSILHDDFKQLADVATVITYDTRGRGRSQRLATPDQFSVLDDVRDLEALRRQLNVEKFVPVGYSYLGKMVAMYALQYPERVTRLIQLGPAAMRSSTVFPKELTHGMEDIAAAPDDVKKWQELRAAGAVTKTPREFCEAQWRVFRYLLVSRPAGAARIHVACDLENEWPANLDVQLAALMASLAKHDVTAEQVKKVTLPVLTIHGRKDRNAPYGSGREWARSLPDARLVTVEDAAHQAWADDPVTVFGAIRPFLRGDWPLGSEKVTE